MTGHSRVSCLTICRAAALIGMSEATLMSKCLEQQSGATVRMCSRREGLLDFAFGAPHSRGTSIQEGPKLDKVDMAPLIALGS